MMTIWKFPFGVIDSFSLMMPKGAKVVHVEGQHDIPAMWVLVDSEAEQVEQTFQVVGTGHPIRLLELYDHAGTFQLAGGSLVFHLFHLRTA